MAHLIEQGAIYLPLYNFDLIDQILMKVSLTEKGMKKTTRSSSTRPHVIEIKTTPAAEVRLKIQQEVTRLQNLSGLNAPMSAKDTLISFADVLELNAVYMAERKDPALQPVIDSNIDLAAKIRYWLA